MLSFPKMENPIGSLVMKILSNRQKPNYFILQDYSPLVFFKSYPYVHKPTIGTIIVCYMECKKSGVLWANVFLYNIYQKKYRYRQ